MHRTLPLLLLLLALPSCYPHTGKPDERSLAELIRQAELACDRGDPAAWKVLAARMLDEHAASLGQELKEALTTRSKDPSPCLATPPLGQLASPVPKGATRP